MCVANILNNESKANARVSSCWLKEPILRSSGDIWSVCVISVMLPSSSRLSPTSSKPSSKSSTSSKLSSKTYKKHGNNSGSDRKKEPSVKAAYKISDESIKDDFVIVENIQNSSDDSFDCVSFSTAQTNISTAFGNSTAAESRANTCLEGSTKTAVEKSTDTATELSASFTEQLQLENAMYAFDFAGPGKENLANSCAYDDDSPWGPGDFYDSIETLACDECSSPCGQCVKCKLESLHSSTSKNASTTVNDSSSMRSPSSTKTAISDLSQSSKNWNQSGASSTKTAKSFSSYSEYADNILTKHSLTQSIYPNLSPSKDEEYLRVLQAREKSIQQSPTPPTKVVRKTNRSTQVEPSTKEQGMQTESLSTESSTSDEEDKEYKHEPLDESACSGTCSCCTYTDTDGPCEGDCSCCEYYSSDDVDNLQNVESKDWLL